MATKKKSAPKRKRTPVKKLAPTPPDAIPASEQVEETIPSEGAPEEVVETEEVVQNPEETITDEVAPEPGGAVGEETPVD